MAAKANLILDVVRRAARCRSGMIEFPVPSVDQEAVKRAESAGYICVIANGVAMVTDSHWSACTRGYVVRCLNPGCPAIAQARTKDRARVLWNQTATKM